MDWGYTIRDYVQFENMTDVKHEYVEGAIRAMAGGSLEHARIAMQIAMQLGLQLRGRPCAVYSADARVRVSGLPVITYPDVSVGCGEARVDAEDPYAQLNPTVIVEVTSPSSESYDRGRKLEFYKHIPSLCEYVIVSHRERAIDVFRRGADGGWTLAARGEAGGRVELTSIGCVVDVDELYDDPRRA
ncbi:MAG TPA: Uma2 family endonuclease [Kofleriaceae bacterium]|nr:Uma2 family endonuclease [Kofleriaceae bacterium]